MGDDGALVPILYAMVVDEDLEVGVKTPLYKESGYDTKSHGRGCQCRQKMAASYWFMGGQII
jgi:hypothetical protein